MRKLISSGYSYEDSYGYSRAVRAGNMVFVSGTTARGEFLAQGTYEQAKSILDIISNTLSDAGASLSDVVRTVTYVSSMNDEPQVARAHREAFHEIRPASTIVEINKLSPEEARVEIEVTAVIDE